MAVRANWKKLFIENLRDSANVSQAALAAGIDRKHVYKARMTDPAFHEAWQEALEIALENLEAEARRRAMSGSDTLLIFLLKSLKPDTYGDKIRVGGQRGLPVQVQALAEGNDFDMEGFEKAYDEFLHTQHEKHAALTAAE